MATIVTLDNLELYKELSDEELIERLSSLQTTIENDVDTKIGNLSLPVEIEDSLPTASADCLNILYLIPSSTEGTNDVYQEYICVEKNGVYSWEKFGTVSITEIQKSGTKGDNNAISDISISGNTITVTYTTLATEDDITTAIGAITAASIGAVPTSRTVNGYALSSDVTITASDLGALTEINASDGDTSGSVVKAVSASGGTITVTKGDLSADDVGALSEISVGASSSNNVDGNVITAIELNMAKDGVLYTKSKLTASDVGAASSSDLASYVLATTKVAGHALSADVTITLTDLSDYSVASDDDIEALFT